MLPNGFWDKVDRKAPDECWNWLASIVGGYGHVRVGDKIKKAHRLSFEDANGPIPINLIVMHTCDNRCCVNPLHLKLGTIWDNNKDRDNKNRGVILSGEDHGNSLLTRSSVKRIHALRAKHMKEIAKLAQKLGVHQNTIKDVMRGRTWKI